MAHRSLIRRCTRFSLRSLVVMMIFSGLAAGGTGSVWLEYQREQRALATLSSLSPSVVQRQGVVWLLL